MLPAVREARLRPVRVRAKAFPAGRERPDGHDTVGLGSNLVSVEHPQRRGVLELVFVLPTTQRVVGSDDQVELLMDRVEASRSLDSDRMSVKMS